MVGIFTNVAGGIRRLTPMEYPMKSLQRSKRMFDLTIGLLSVFALLLAGTTLAFGAARPGGW